MLGCCSQLLSCEQEAAASSPHLSGLGPLCQLEPVSRPDSAPVPGYQVAHEAVHPDELALQAQPLAPCAAETAAAAADCLMRLPAQLQVAAAAQQMPEWAAEALREQMKNLACSAGMQTVQEDEAWLAYLLLLHHLCKLHPLSARAQQLYCPAQTENWLSQSS